MTTNPAAPFEPVDWMDAYGHYWAWDRRRAVWVHDRDRCQLLDGQPCEARS
jgi:hypothetical protein